MGAAEQIGQAVKGKLATLLACDPAKDGEGPCLDKFLDGFGTRAWRRPLEAEREGRPEEGVRRQQGGRLRRRHRCGGAGDDAGAAVQLPAGARGAGRGRQLRAPDPLGDGLPAVVPAVGDDARRRPAGRGPRRQAGHPRRGDGTGQAPAGRPPGPGDGDQLRRRSGCSCASWPRPTRTPRPTPTSRTSTWICSARRPRASSAEVWKGDAKLDTLLTASFSMVNAELATLYGAKGVTGTELRKVDLDPDPAGGGADPAERPGRQGRAGSVQPDPPRGVRARADVLSGAAAAARPRPTPSRRCWTRR